MATCNQREPVEEPQKIFREEVLSLRLPDGAGSMQLLGLAGVYNAVVQMELVSFGWFWEPMKLERVEDSVKIVRFGMSALCCASG